MNFSVNLVSLLPIWDQYGLGYYPTGFPAEECPVLCRIDDTSAWITDIWLSNFTNVWCYCKYIQLRHQFGYINSLYTPFFRISKLNEWHHAFKNESYHYNDVIMSTMASQITIPTIFYLIVYSDADQRKHQSAAWLAFVRGIHRWPGKSPHKGSVTRKMFSLIHSLAWQKDLFLLIPYL